MIGSALQSYDFLDIFSESQMDKPTQVPIRKLAMDLYTPPFTFQGGYIFDSKHHMVADQGGITERDVAEAHIVARIRGWGRIGYLPDAAKLQDEVGHMLADALNALYAATTTYIVAQQHPTLPEVSMWLTTSRAEAETYRGIGWTVCEVRDVPVGVQEQQTKSVVSQNTPETADKPLEWVMVSPDGLRFIGTSPGRAALAASKHQLDLDPKARARFLQVVEQMAEEGRQEREQCLRDFGTLDCPSCGGSGHIADTTPETRAAAFWAGVYPDGWTAERVEAEMTDYHMILDGLDGLIMHVTGGKCSKPNTDKSVIRSLFDDYLNDCVAEALREQSVDRRRLMIRARDSLASMASLARTAYGNLDKVVFGEIEKAGKVVDDLQDEIGLEHDLYTTADPDRPDGICDRNGEVVLGLCKRCGKGESELEEICAPRTT